MTNPSEIEQELAAQLEELLAPHLARWEREPPQGPLSTAVMSFKSVHRSVAGPPRRFGPSDETFLAQGLKFMRSAESADDNALVAEVKRWKKAWDARPLPNEACLSQLLESGVRALANKEATVQTLLVDGETTLLPGKKWNFYSVFEEHRGKGAVAVVAEKGHLSLYSDSGDILDRLFQALNKRLTKELGKAKGSGKSKEFVSGRASLYASRQTTPKNDAFPFPKEQISYSTRGGTLTILQGS